jgi:S1-C subfamily serine protease
MAKTVKLIFAFFLFIVQTSIGQIINPSFTSREVNYCDVLKIEKNKSNTIIYFKYTAPSNYINGGWVCVGNNFFIRDINTRTTYKLIKANNIPICPNKHNFQYKDQELEFNLVFEALPPSVDRIDIIEDETNHGFNFFGVNLITNLNNSSTSIQPSNLNEECDNINYIPKSNKPDFQTMLAGVKHAVIMSKTPDSPAYTGLFSYLKAINFETVMFLDEYNDSKITSEVVYVDVKYDFDYNNFYNIILTYTIPETDYTWEFRTNSKVKAGAYDKTNYDFDQVYRSIYSYIKADFNSYYTIKLPKRQTCWTETNLKNYINSKGCNNIEGIYENSTSSATMAKYKVAVKKMNNIYYLIYFSGAGENGNWSEGEIKATLESTATPLFYKAKWIMANKIENSNIYISFENGLMNVIDSNNNKELYIKLFPTATDNFITPSETSSSGTGYAISSNGYIVTNHHVTNGATSIKIRGINGDFSKKYSAKIIIEDKNNDLSIIKIDDQMFKSLGTIPYIIANRTSDVGSSIFVLGYPLRATMGDEVKLTNGIISSKSGFQGDVTSYQITAPIQSGNSGGPLFDEKGNIIGIINAKHVGAENVSYAIKVSYLMNLIDLMPSAPKLQTISTVSGKSLTEQVKILKNFTYIIEIN